jgi:hypothetical protein
MLLSRTFSFVGIYYFFHFSAIVRSYINKVVTMSTTTTQPSVKVIGANGQISLGKHYAGRQVLVEEQEPGVWLIRTATIIPDNESWLYQPKAAADLRNALSWAQANKPFESNLDTMMEKLSGEA